MILFLLINMVEQSVKSKMIIIIIYSKWKLWRKRRERWKVIYFWHVSIDLDFRLSLFILVCWTKWKPTGRPFFKTIFIQIIFPQLSRLIFVYRRCNMMSSPSIQFHSVFFHLLAGVFFSFWDHNIAIG